MIIKIIRKNSPKKELLIPYFSHFSNTLTHSGFYLKKKVSPYYWFKMCVPVIVEQTEFDQLDLYIEIVYFK